MESNFITSNTKKLIIGDFVIDFRKENHARTLAIPYAGMAFYHPETFERSKKPETETSEEKSNNIDFEYLVDTDHDCSESGTIAADMSDVRENITPDHSRDTLVYGSEDFNPPTFVYRRGDGSYQWIERKVDDLEKVVLHISPDWLHFKLLEYKHRDEGEYAFKQFGSLFAYAVLNHHACVLHGVVMEYQGKGILITAPSGTGKTTHTRMWREEKNALILNGDRCLCRKVSDTWYAYGMPWSGSSGEYINRKALISAIVVLEQSQTNVVEQMNEFPAFVSMMERVFAPQWDRNLYQKAIDYCGELVKELPVYRLSCRPDLEAVEVLEKTIFKL